MQNILYKSIFVTSFCWAIYIYVLPAYRSSTLSAQAQAENNKVERAIKLKWNASPGIKSANLNCKADFDSGTIILSGKVNNQKIRLKAFDLAESAQSGFVLVDQIIVNPQEALETSQSSFSKEISALTKESLAFIGTLLAETAPKAKPKLN